MFAKNSKTSKELDLAISDLYQQLQSNPFYTEGYTTITNQLERLYKLKELDSKKRVSPDTLLVVAGNLAVALIIVAYEERHVVTTKALSFLAKFR